MRRPFRAESFDAVVGAFPTEYIFDPATLREVARVPSEEGRLVIVAGAQPRGTPPDRHFLDWLSSQIGEADSQRGGPASVFAQAGLRARIECRRVGATTVFLIVAEKVPAALAGVRELTDSDLDELERLEPALRFGERQREQAFQPAAPDPVGYLGGSTVLRAD